VREAIVEGQLVPAGPDSPEEAICLVCGSVIRKRKRCNMDRQAVYFCQRETRVGEKRPNRHHH
jgi:hypothetical protein